MNNSCVLIPYFGHWPSFFNIYLKSCSYNQELDFLFFTDITPPDVVPNNVKFFSMSLQEIRALFSKKLGFAVNLNQPYKLCDLRPAFGLAFEGYIKNYEYWGYGDIDLVLGDVNSFLKEIHINNCDIISLRKEWCSGSFSILKNTPKVNTLFMKEPRYKDVFINENYCGFDECGKQFQNFIKGISNLEDVNLPPNFSIVTWKESRNNSLNIHFKTLIKESINPHELVCWDKGKIYQEGKTYLLYHYITEKRRNSFFFPNWTNVPDKFYIDNTGFYTEKSLKRRKAIRIIRKVMGFYCFCLDIKARAMKKYL